MEVRVRRDTEVWLRPMPVAFFDGLGPFGLKVLATRGLAAYQSQYLFFWYLGGLVFALAALWLARAGVNRREVFLAAMGAFSFAGQSFTAKALAKGLPGILHFRSPPADRCSWWRWPSSRCSVSESAHMDCVALFLASPL